MGPTGLLVYISVLLAFFSATQAYNVTRLLGQYPEFGLLNQYINDSGLAGEINRRGTVTILAVDNSTLSSISGRSKDSIKAIVSTHVILDYYDEKKLMNIKNDSTTLTTLFQSSGIANDNQGHILAYNAGGGHFYFGSAVKGASLNAQFVKTVVTQPYNISVLQVSQPIIPPGIDAQSPWPAPGARTAFPPKKHDGSSDTPAAESPSNDDDSAAADAPSDDVASSPSPSSAPATAPGPADKSAAADEDSGSDSSSSSSLTRVKMGLVGTVMALASLLVAL
ncbi:hypothetical protein QN277_017596 [Acacia crassicarpa]|uniref:FAS1 domain-containing protein n=1 Tax=Acacia crassicarpa TaxID=499986 RepID=A0AAE1JTZ7_9FABA|nr:hypothetical protein QN277_017596 [Acacia crassicarpa]